MGKDENKNTPRQAVGCGRRHNIIRGLESALSTAIEKGMSAVTLSKRVSKYLRDLTHLKRTTRNDLERLLIFMIVNINQLV